MRLTPQIRSILTALLEAEREAWQRVETTDSPDYSVAFHRTCEIKWVAKSRALASVMDALGREVTFTNSDMVDDVETCNAAERLLREAN